MIYSYNKSQRDAQFSQIYLIKYSTCFGQVHYPSSGVSQHCMQTMCICRASSVGVCQRGHDGTSFLSASLVRMEPVPS